MSSYYFEVLPIHPPSIENESITGYATWLNELNGVQDMASFRRLFFPKISQNTLKHWSDFPIQELDTFAKLTCTSEFELRKMTFYPMAVFFNRSDGSNGLNRFLNSSLNKYFHYCPLCIKDNSRYSIFWRFYFITDCHIHKVKLRTICIHCGEKLPIFASPFSIKFCSKCGQDLAKGSIEQSVGRLDYLEKKIKDLQFIFDSGGLGESYSLDVLGRKLKLLRRENGYSQLDVSQELNIPLYRLSNWESEAKKKYIGSFKQLMKYIDFLGSSIIEIHNMPKPGKHFRIRYTPFYERRDYCKYTDDVLLDLVEDAITELKISGDEITLKNISQLSEISEATFYRRRNVIVERFPEIPDISLETSIEAIKNRLKRVKQVIPKMKKQGIPIHFASVGDYLNIDPQKLYGHPTLNSYIQEQGKLQLYEEQSTLLLALDKIEAEGKLRYRSEILKHLGLHLRALKIYPDVRQRIMPYPETPTKNMSFDERSEYYLDKVQSFLEENKGKKVTQLEIAAAIGISATGLKRYPEINEIMKKIGEDWRNRGKENFEDL